MNSRELPPAPTLVVAGMHRSGTSFVAGLLHSAGLFMGDRLIAGDARNVRGYFEDRDFVDYHRRLLAANGLAEDGLVADVDLVPTPRFRREAELLVESRRNHRRPWGWKDPRTTLLLPFWSTVVPDAAYLFVFRPPWDVIDSLFRRGDAVFDRNPQLALAVWTAYNTRLRDFARAHPDRVLVRELSQVAADPQALCESIQSHLHVTLDRRHADFLPGQLHAAAPGRSEFLAAASPACVNLLNELRALADVAVSPTPVSSGDVEPLEEGMIAWHRSRRLERLSPRPQEVSGGEGIREAASSGTVVRPHATAGTGRRVFIAVPVYRGEAFVEETLRSIRQQEHKDFRVCISVDGEDQGSAALCQPFLEDPRFEMHIQPSRLGWAGNLNWLMDRCDGDFFCFWQQDDLAATSYLAHLVGHAVREPDAACLFSDVQWFGTRIDRVETPSLTGFALGRVLEQIERAHYAPFFGLVPAAVLSRVGHIRITPNDSPLEDQVWLAMLLAEGPWHRVPGTLYFKRGHGAETHGIWENSADDAFRRLSWLEWGAGMFEAIRRVSPPQEHGRMLDLVVDRLTEPRGARSQFYAPRAHGVDESVAFRDDFENLVRQRFNVVSAGERLLDARAAQAARQGSVSVEIGRGEPGLGLLMAGWAAPEPGGVWSDGSSAILRLPNVSGGPWRIRLVASPFPGCPVERALSVRSGDRIVARHVYAAHDEGDGGAIEFHVDSPARLVLEMPWARSPREMGLSSDERRLGICLHRVLMQEAAGSAAFEEHGER